jgi:aminopeptidase N
VAAKNEKEAWMVRAEAVRALGRIRADQAFRELSRLTKVNHPKVRRAVAAALGNHRTPEAAALLTPLARKDASYLVEAEAARALGRTRQTGVVKTLLGIVDRESWADVIRAGALDGMANSRDESAVDAVMTRTAYGYPTRGRRAAIGALPTLSDSRKVREHLEGLLEDRDPHLKIEVIYALEKLGDTRARGALRRAQERELDGRVVRRIREALRDLGEAGSAEKKRVNDELENLKDELAELKSRFSKLEAGKSKAPPEPVKAVKKPHRTKRGSA